MALIMTCHSTHVSLSVHVYMYIIIAIKEFETIIFGGGGGGGLLSIKHAAMSHITILLSANTQ